MTFRAIGVYDKSKLLFIEGIVDARKYIDNLEALGFMQEFDEKRGALNWIFQQDGAPCHTAQEVIDWIEESCDLICDWLANSPDLNPIELLWAILKNIVTKQGPKTVDELKQILFQVWNSIFQTTIRGLCRSFEARLRICFDLEGASISKHLWLCCDRSALTAWELEQMTLYVAWNAEEDSTFYRLVRTTGPKWKIISGLTPRRSACQVKNR
jgi:hypothetical protein